MKEETKVDISVMKPEMENNELTPDVKSSIHSGVIPVVPAVEKKPVEEPAVVDSSITNNEFIVTIVKTVTGTGCLTIPFTVTQLGIIPSIFVFFLVTLANIINTHYLIEANEGLKKRNLNIRNGLKIDNDYANLMYQLYGMSGYYIFLVFFYMTVWSVLLGTMISMFDFIKGLPWPESFLGNKTARDLFLHIVSTLLCYVLCCIRNTKQLFFVSWFGIFTLLLAYVVVVIYGLATYPIHFDPQLLWSRGAKAFFANLGVAPYTLGYNFCFLTYYKQVVPSQQSKTFGITAKSILGVCAAYLLFSIPTTIAFSSGGDASNNWNIQDNIVSNLGNGACGVIIKLLMWASCVCSHPVVLSSTTELLEKNCPATRNTFFVYDRQRLLIRFLQIGILSFIAYVLPFFGELVNLFGGFAFVATSILIPVVLHYSVFKSTMKNQQKLIHAAVGLGAFLLMVIATVFSTINLVDSMSGK